MAIVPRILVFAGSIRTGAYSGRTADAAQKELAMQGAEVTRISLADYPLPIMDQDLEREKGIPENAMKLARLIAAHDAVLICTPEYNGSIPPLREEHDRLGEPRPQGRRQAAQPLPRQGGRHLLVLRRALRRHPQRQSSARRAVAYRHGGDLAAGLGAARRRGVRRGRQLQGGAAAQGNEPALQDADRACPPALDAVRRHERGAMSASG